MNYGIMAFLAIAAGILAVRSELKFLRRLRRLEVLRGELSELSLAKEDHSRKSFYVSELPKETIDGIARDKMTPRYDHLNELMEEDGDAIQ